MLLIVHLLLLLLFVICLIVSALHSFREKVLKSIGNGVIEQINNQVTQLRKGEATNEDLLVEAINVVSLVDPKHEFVYKQLELAYLQTASKYYANVGDKVIKTMSLAQFFRRVSNYLTTLYMHMRVVVHFHVM